jgi:cytosine deaminase
MLTLPDTESYVLADATVPIAATEGLVAAATEGLVRADIVIRAGNIADIAAAGTITTGLPSVDLAGRMVWPCFADMHTHIDKGHIWERNPNPDGTFDSALATVRADREANWSAEDVAKRMDFSLRCAEAHGTSLLRTHIDSLPPQHRISFPVFREMRETWEGRIDLQAAALFPLYAMEDKDYFADLITVLKDSGAILGGVPQMGTALDTELDTLIRAASDNGLDIDLHVDETADREVLTLKAIARAVLRNRFEGTVTVGHCCSLIRQDEETAKRTIDLVAQARLAVVSLPMCNMYLQDRHAGRTPRWRGVTLFKELAAAGVRAAVASDNTRDPFYAYGDLDPVEVFREAVRILHLDHPLSEAAAVVTKTPADILGRSDKSRIASGLLADLILFSARCWSEFLSRPQSDRMVIRRGRATQRIIPDYAELDDINGA